MKNCFFVSDLHGKRENYEKLFNSIMDEKPEALFLGGDILPHPRVQENFITDYLIPKCTIVKDVLQEHYPRIFIILGNDDARSEEKYIIEGNKLGIWEYLNLSKTEFSGYNIYGYNFTPPSPFLLKDWEKYDVSRFVDAGCISPEEGKRTVDISYDDKKYSTIQKDLDSLTTNLIPDKSIFLFHAPPYQTNLDRAALDGKIIDQIQVDLHVGSIAIKRFIEKYQPYLTLHGHIHEAARLTGSWKDRIGTTNCFSVAHDGKELAIIKFNLDNPDAAERVLL